MTEPEGTTKRRLSAIMFSDICGFSKLMGEDEDRGLDIMNLHTRLAEKAVTECEGHIIKKMADGLLFEFPSAVSAVECALMMQTSLREFSEENPEDSFQIRIGVHLGDVVVSGDDIHGDGINVASRIEPLAPPGGICISQDVYNLVHNKVEIQVVSLGPQQLKNIKRQMEIFRVLVAASDAQDGYTVKTIPREAVTDNPRPAGPRRRWPWILAGALVALALLLFFATNRGKRRNQEIVDDGLQHAVKLAQQGNFEQAAKALEVVAGRVPADTPRMDEVRDALAGLENIDQAAQALHKAAAMLHEGNRLDAVRLLEDARRRLPKNRPGLETLYRMLSELTREAKQKHVRDRFTEWLIALRDKDWESAAKIADPKSRMKHGTAVMKLRMSFIGGAAQLLKLGPDHVRVGEIQIQEDGKQAVLVPEFLTQDGWKPQKPMRWVLHEEQWYIRIEDKPRTNGGEGTRSGPGSRFHRRPPRHRPFGER
jgi:class 3 adenylate cyclase